MENPFRTSRLRQRIGAFYLILLLVTLGACQRRARTPTPPPPPNYLAIGDRSYDTGDYPAAIAAYTTYLREAPVAAERDRVLFRLGMSYALPSSASQDAAQAIRYLDELVSRYPESPWRPEAELLSGLHRRIQLLLADVSERESALARLSTEMESRSLEYAQKVEELEADLTEGEATIRHLNEELDRLKAIDLRRRPATPAR